MAYENFSHLRVSPAAGGWLKTVATNLTLNYLTRYPSKRWRLFSGPAMERGRRRRRRRRRRRGGLARAASRYAARDLSDEHRRA